MSERFQRIHSGVVKPDCVHEVAGSHPVDAAAVLVGHRHLGEDGAAHHHALAQVVGVEHGLAAVLKVILVVVVVLVVAVVGVVVVAALGAALLGLEQVGAAPK